MNQSYDKKTVFCWSLYDFANQPFTTLVITFIYGTFFTTVLADNEITGTILWSRGISLTGIIVALLSPIMGALADRGGYRKFYLIFWTWVCIICSFLLWYPNVGQVTFALTLFIIANVGFEMGGVFCNAFLPDIAPKDKIGRVSGYGWSFGYVGGLLSLILALVFFIFPEVPLFDLDKILSDNALSCLLTNRPDITKHLKDSTLYYLSNLFVNNYMEKCVTLSPKLIIELCIILDLFINNTYYNLINPDDTNFQLFSIILNSQLAVDLSDKLEEILSDSEVDYKDILDEILGKFSNNINKEIEKRVINIDVYVANLRISLNKTIISLLK